MPRLSASFLLATSLGLACYVGDGGGGSFGDEGPSGDGSETEGETDEATGGQINPMAPDVAEFIEEAKKEFPTYLDLHEKVITRTCTPNANVCHNNKEYPDLRTPQAMLAMFDSPCNIDVEDPLNTFNGCEPVGDVLRFTTGSNMEWEAQIAYVIFEPDPMDGSISAVELHLANAVPVGMLDPTLPESVEVRRTTEGGMLTVGRIDDAVTYTAGADTLRIEGYGMLGDGVHTLLEDDVRVADTNRDGVFGAEGDRMHELTPGDPRSSYLLQRLQGNVPGSPMPLANQPLSTAEVVAIACWIEGADQSDGQGPYAVIEYDSCDYAAEISEPDPDSGATFSGDVQPLLTLRCATAGCHSADQAAADLDLSEGVARENLLNQMSTQNPVLPLVTSLNPTNSYLMTKLTGDGFSGKQMPLNSAPLSAEEIDIVRKWINLGAPDD